MKTVENYDEDFRQAMESLAAYEKEIQQFNSKLLSDNKINKKDYKSLINDCTVTGKIEIVSNPKGSNNHEDAGMFTEIWVDQWTTGESSDSYAGFIYGKLSKTKWLKVPYEC